MNLDQATLDHCKAWIDYRCATLREDIGPLDPEGAAQDLDVDKAMAVSQHNTLMNLRLEIDSSQTPEGYKVSPQIYIRDNDMEELRLFKSKAEAEIERLRSSGARLTKYAQDLQELVKPSQLKAAVEDAVNETTKG